MYSIIDPEKTYDNANICLSQGILYRTQKNQDVPTIFKIFPNPAYDQVTISYHIGEEQKANLIIQNCLGQSLQLHELSGDQSELNLNIQMLMSGIYTVKIVLDKQVLQQEKLVILR
ncbi:MAG: T9SS type A sorting domain-containing protein [Bacteroidetes bacterium]|nr:MAG: T9SS type A sorting domain-containing protein [Bacteroidota bacterium]